MNKVESIVIGVIVGFACPALTFVAFWWTTAAIHMQWPQVPVGAVIASAFTGLALGLVLDILYLKRWVRGFYTANLWILAAVYLGLSAGAVALFMGVPAGTFLLGIGGGVYAGRRMRHSSDCIARATPLLRRTAAFAALVTTAAALPIGLLALQDESVVESLADLLHVSQTSLRGLAGIAFVAMLCLVLFVGQYWCSKIAGEWSFVVGRSGNES